MARRSASSTRRDSPSPWTVGFYSLMSIFTFQLQLSPSDFRALLIRNVPVPGSSPRPPKAGDHDLGSEARIKQGSLDGRYQRSNDSLVLRRTTL